MGEICNTFVERERESVVVIEKRLELPLAIYVLQRKREQNDHFPCGLSYNFPQITNDFVHYFTIIY